MTLEGDELPSRSEKRKVEADNIEVRREGRAEKSQSCSQHVELSPKAWHAFEGGRGVELLSYSRQGQGSAEAQLGPGMQASDFLLLRILAIRTLTGSSRVQRQSSCEHSTRVLALRVASLHARMAVIRLTLLPRRSHEGDVRSRAPATRMHFLRPPAREVLAPTLA